MKVPVCPGELNVRGFLGTLTVGCGTRDVTPASLSPFYSGTVRGWRQTSPDDVDLCIGKVYLRCRFTLYVQRQKNTTYCRRFCCFVFLFFLSFLFYTVPLQCLWRDSVTLISTLLLTYLLTYLRTMCHITMLWQIGNSRRGTTLYLKKRANLPSCTFAKHGLILIILSKQHCHTLKQEAQLSQIDRATLRVIEYFAKSLKVTQDHSKWHCWVGRV